MKNKIRPIDANALALKISEYMVGFPKRSERMFTCMHILSMLEDENQTPTLAGFVPDYDGEKLTMDQLKRMVGKPVWSKKFKEWFLILKEDYKYLLFDKMGHYVPLWSDVIDRGLYAYPPVRIDREKWEPCEWCGSVGKTPDNWVCTLEDENGHTVTNQHIVVCATANYCPSCGRPLTPEAWEELEARLMHKCPISESLESCEDCGFCGLEGDDE